MIYSEAKPIQELHIDSIKGKMTEIYGGTDTGKTLFALAVCEAFLQKSLESIVFYFDADCKLSLSQLFKHQIDGSRFFIYISINDIVSMLPMILDITDVLVIDSLPMYRDGMPRHLLSKLSLASKEFGITVIVINQTRANFKIPHTTRPYYDNISRIYYDYRINMDNKTFIKGKRQQLIPITDKLAKIINNKGV